MRTKEELAGSRTAALEAAWAAFDAAARPHADAATKAAWTAAYAAFLEIDAQYAQAAAVDAKDNA